MTALPEPNFYTSSRILEVYAQNRIDKERTYLGASVIGEECDRKLWYQFRWATPPEVFEGRMLYLFDTGHVEEKRLLDALDACPEIQVWQADESGEQFAFADLNGHFRGHMDGAALGLPEAPKTPHAVEVKTHNDKSFKLLLKEGVKTSKPKHYAQMQIYMHYFGFERCLYLALNKNDSTIHSERVNFDQVYALRLIEKARYIIDSHESPAKLFEDPTSKMAWVCTRCASRGVCHEGKFARINCRTCLFSTPIEKGWHCEKHNMILDVETQRIGCSNHLYLPGLVPGMQIGASSETVSYILHDGSNWVDGIVEKNK